ncbi:MAG: DUF2807 domain-containing protein [Flavobacteriaceae bacterium]|nr:DUF2807 domain-containing protein [Flavobacteriaceae bacterium]
MRKAVTFLSGLFMVMVLWSCDSENGLNCFQAAGDIIQEDFNVAPFQKILVRQRVQLFISEGPTQRVVVETGANLLNDIVVEVLDNTLVVKNDNGCNIVRDYGLTKVYVTSPNISQIRNSSGLAVESIGPLTYPELELISEDQENEDEFHIDGDFRIHFEGGELRLIASGLSNFYLNGTAETGSFELYDGDSRVEAADLFVKDLNIFHRSTQTMFIHPTESLTGEIRGLGDVISFNRPLIVLVDEYFTGKLIFQD